VSYVQDRLAEIRASLGENAQVSPSRQEQRSKPGKKGRQPAKTRIEDIRAVVASHDRHAVRLREYAELADQLRQEDIELEE
jgi:hypothetical protein